MTQSIVRQSDLVLSVVGGARHGKTLSISTAKCVLAFENDSSGASRPARCAILRGKAGVTIRNLDKQVSFNGHFSPTHWLKEGDLIQFPNSVALRVTQLGVFDEDTELSSRSAGFSGNSPDQIDYQSICPGHHSSERVGFEGQTENEAEPQLSRNHWEDHENYGLQDSDQPDSHNQLSCEPIEAKRITEMVDNRFEEIEKRINQLTEQISSLVTLATTGQFSSTRLNEAEWKSHLNSPAEIQDLQKPLSEHSDDRQHLDSPRRLNDSDNWQGSGLWGRQSFQGKPAEESDSGTATIENGTIENGAIENANRFPVVEESALPTTFAEWSGRLEPASVDVGSDLPLLTPVRRDENSKQDLSGLIEKESDFSKSSDPHTFFNSGTAQKEFGQAGSFRAATNALNQFQSRDANGQSDEPGLADHNPISKSHSISPNRVQPESDSSNFSSATPSTDEALDALLKRLYQNQNSDSPHGDYGKLSEVEPVSLEKRSESDALEERESFRRELAEAQLNDDSFAANPRANMQFGYDLSSNTTPDDPQSLDSHGLETGFDSSGTGFGEITGAASHQLDTSSRVAFEPAIDTAIDAEVDIPASDTSGRSKPELSSGNSAIMDLLAKLKAEGAWDDGEVRAADIDLPDSSESRHVISYSSDESETECIVAESNLEEEVAAAETETVVEEEEVPVAADSVEDYMSQLLARMQKKRGDSEPAVKRNAEKVAKEVEAKSLADAKMADQELMTAEEYVPKQKAQKIHSFDTMRELANTTARTAVAYSDLDRRRTKGYMQVIITIGALIMAGYYFLFLAKEQGDTSFVIGCVCVTISLGAGYLAFRTLTGLKNRDKKPVN